MSQDSFATTLPLLKNALRLLEKAKESRDLTAESPRFGQAILEAEVSLKFAIDSLLGAESLLASAAYSESEAVKEIRAALQPSKELGEYLHMTEDAVLTAAYWTIFDRLVVPQMDSLRNLIAPLLPE
jgi:hypothetical protein